MKRIVIIGCPGSGKSTLARELGEKLELTVVHLDRLWGADRDQFVSMEEFDARLEKALELDGWVIDGNYSRTMDARLARCDTIIYLDFDRWTCLWGVLQRMLRHDQPESWQERINREMLRNIWNFNKNNRVLNQTRIAKSRHAKAIVLKNRKELQSFLQQL